MKRLDNYVKMIGGVAGLEYTRVAVAYADLIDLIGFAIGIARVPLVAGETIDQALNRANAKIILLRAAPNAANRINLDYFNAIKALAEQALLVIVAAEAAAAAVQPAAAAVANVNDANAAAAAATAAATAAAGRVVDGPINETKPRSGEIGRVAAQAARLVEIAAAAAAPGAPAPAPAPGSVPAPGPGAPAPAPGAPAPAPGPGVAGAAAAAVAAAAVRAPPAPPAPAPQAVYYDSGPAEPTSFNVSVYRTKDGKDSFVGTRPAYPSTSVKTILDGLKQSGETVIVSSGEQFVKSLNGKETYSTLGNLRLKSESVKFFVL